MIATINDILECEWCASLLQKFNLHKPTNHYWICWLMMWLTRPKCKTIFFGRWILFPDNPYCWCLLDPKFNRNFGKVCHFRNINSQVGISVVIISMANRINYLCSNSTWNFTLIPLGKYMNPFLIGLHSFQDSLTVICHNGRSGP